MCRIRTNIQAGMNEVDGLLTAKDRQIADLINQAHATRRPRKRRRHHRSEGIDNSQAPNPAAVEERTRAAGRRFALLKSLFFIDDERVWAVQKDETFNRTKEFDSDEGRIQGQLLDVLDVLPEDVHEWRQDEWLSLATTAHSSWMAWTARRATIAHHIRSQSLSTLVADATNFESSTSRKSTFHDLIGYNAPTETSHAFYSSYKVAILYDEYDGTVDLDHIFRHPVLLRIFACLIRGPNGAKGLLEGTSKRPQAKCVEKLYNVKRITAGVIVNCAILGIWLHSPDTQLQATGDTTHINYSARLSEYLWQLVEGLRSQAEWAEGLLKRSAC
ncbi:hypothetical protein B0H14DRAFT_1323110 [Mycena olivaceomarginata]|nr:hypothetical protein B0H14DRAFT_1323110 [Mycena olivaceomarginata]